MNSLTWHGRRDVRALRCSATPSQAVEYTGTPERGSIAVIGLGPIGEMSCRIAQHRGADQVIGIDLVPGRLARARTK